MFRIDDSTAAVALPTPEVAGTPGYFTEGNPTTGVAATNVRGSWLNMIQEELMSIVTAGGLTPDKTTYNQVLNAIKAVAIGQFISSFSANGYVKLPNGMIIQWGQVGGVGTGGTTATYPIAFPNNAFVTVPYVSVSSGPVTQYVNSVSTGTPKTTITFALNTGTAAVGYIAIGN